MSYDYSDRENEDRRIKTELGSSKTYTSSKDRYENLNSSAMSLLFIGSALLIFSVLLFTGVINLPLNIVSKVMFLIMGAGSIVYGFISLSQARQAKEKIGAETDAHEEMIGWFKENISAEKIDEAIDAQSEGYMAPEVRSFKRLEWIGGLISERFGIKDEAYLDTLSEEIYEMLFE